MEEAFFRTHRYLVEHINAPVRRTLMDEIDWNDRMIGIKSERRLSYCNMPRKSLVLTTTNVSL